MVPINHTRLIFLGFGEVTVPFSQLLRLSGDLTEIVSEVRLVMLVCVSLNVFSCSEATIGLSTAGGSLEDV